MLSDSEVICQYVSPKSVILILPPVCTSKTLILVLPFSKRDYACYSSTKYEYTSVSSFFDEVQSIREKMTTASPNVNILDYAH